MLLSAMSVLAVAQPISEVPEGLMNYPLYFGHTCDHSREGEGGVDHKEYITEVCEPTHRC